MKSWKLIAGVVAVAVLGAAAWYGWKVMSSPKLPDGIVEGHGRIEAIEITVGSKVAARIDQLLVKEGDRVRKGDLIAKLSAEEVGQRVVQAEAKVEVADAQVKLREEETRARLTEANARLAASQERVSQVQERIDTLKHHLEKARADNRRDRDLVAKGFISERQMSNAENALRQAEGDLAEANKQLAATRAETDAARAARDGIVRQTPSLLKSTEQEAAAARASRQEAGVTASELRIIAPDDGVVITKAAEAGELVFPGRALVVLADLERPYLRIYIAERDIGKVKLGDPARVYVDSFPDRPFDATVTEVANKAEFTPKDVHMPDERVTLVYGVKLEIRNPQGLIKPGMPADARVRWKPEALWGK